MSRIPYTGYAIEPSAYAKREPRWMKLAGFALVSLLFGVATLWACLWAIGWWSG